MISPFEKRRKQVQKKSPEAASSAPASNGRYVKPEGTFWMV
jgi:hypothetical protein